MTAAPTSVGSRYRLGADQLAGFERDGFLIFKGLYEPEQMLEWKRTILGILDEERKAEGNDAWNAVASSGVRVWNLDNLHPTLLAAMRDDHVVPILQQIVGTNLEFLSVKAVFKNDATSFASPWHQDWFYWEGSNKVSIWIALDDATRANGCLRFVPGSHKKVFPRTVVGGNAFVNQVEAKHIEGLPIVDVEVKRGDAVFFHDLAIHSSYPNVAKTDRWSMISTYRDAATKDDSNLSPHFWKRPVLISGQSVNGGK